MDNRDLALLAASPFLAKADPRDLARFFSRRPPRISSHAPGSLVLLAGCSYDELRVVLEGRAHAELASPGGRSMIVESFGAPEAIATALLFSPARNLPVTLVAGEELRIASIPRDSLLELCAEQRPVLLGLLEDMGSRVAFLADRLRATSFSSLRERLADWLLARAFRGPGGLEVRLGSSKERLASVFGVARPSLSREFGELEKRGLIESKGRSVRILDEEGLRRLLEPRG